MTPTALQSSNCHAHDPSDGPHISYFNPPSSTPPLTEWLGDLLRRASNPHHRRRHQEPQLILPIHLAGRGAAR